MTIQEIEDKLYDMLGDTYGGPSIFIEGGRFVLYNWVDDPVVMNEMASGDTLQELIENYSNNV